MRRRVDHNLTVVASVVAWELEDCHKCMTPCGGHCCAEVLMICQSELHTDAICWPQDAALTGKVRFNSTDLVMTAFLCQCRGSLVVAATQICLPGSAAFESCSFAAAIFLTDGTIPHVNVILLRHSWRVYGVHRDSKTVRRSYTAGRADSDGKERGRLYEEESTCGW